jgi:hypothetical protein
MGKPQPSAKAVQRKPGATPCLLAESGSLIADSFSIKLRYPRYKNNRIASLGDWL